MPAARGSIDGAEAAPQPVDPQDASRLLPRGQGHANVPISSTATPSDAPTNAERQGRALDYVAVLVVAAVATVLRVFDLGGRALWLDEAHTFNRAALPIPELIDNAIANLHTPPYFIGIHYWMKVAGESEVALRAPSAVFGVLTVLLTYVAGRVAAGRFVGFAAALMLALVPEHIHYGQEARMYSALTAGAGLALAGNLWLARHPQRAALRMFGAIDAEAASETRQARTAWAAIVVGCLLAAWMHNLGSLVIAASGLSGLFILANERQQRAALLRNGVIAYGAVGAGWLWWLPVMAGQRTRLEQHDWGALTLAHVQRLFERLYFFATANVAVELGLLALMLAGCWALRRQPNVLVTLLLFALFSPLAMIVVSIHQPLLAPRLLIAATLGFVILLAVGLRAVPLKAGAWVTLLVIVVWAGAVQVPHYFAKRKRPPWRDVATLLIAEAGDKDDAVFYAPTPTALEPLFYYLAHMPGGERIKPQAVNERRIARAARRGRWIWLMVADRKDMLRSGMKRAIIGKHATLNWERSYTERSSLSKYLAGKHER